MSKILSQALVERYRRDGFAFPVAVLNAADVRRLRADLACWETMSPKAQAAHSEALRLLCVRQDQGFTKAVE
jgi:phosphodiesterase/alkaline phosphatase D-like protein